MMHDPRHASDDSEVISYEALVAGNVVLIAIGRETIEDYLGEQTSTSETRLAFVNANMPMLTRCAAEKLRAAPHELGIMLKHGDLPARKP